MLASDSHARYLSVRVRWFDSNWKNMEKLYVSNHLGVAKPKGQEFCFLVYHLNDIQFLDHPKKNKIAFESFKANLMSAKISKATATRGMHNPRIIRSCRSIKTNKLRRGQVSQNKDFLTNLRFQAFKVSPIWRLQVQNL